MLFLLFRNAVCRLRENNFSYSHVNEVSTFQIGPPQDINQETGYVEFCSICDNYAIWCVLLSLWKNNENYDTCCIMKYCNIIRNSHGTSDYRLIRSNIYLTISNTCILENDVKGNNNMFYIIQRTMTIVNCTIEESYLNKVNGNGQFNTSNWKPENGSFINAIKCTMNEYCYATFDVVGTLTPIIPSFIPTNDNSTPHCQCTQCHHSLYQPRFSLFISILAHLKE